MFGSNIALIFYVASPAGGFLICGASRLALYIYIYMYIFYMFVFLLVFLASFCICHFYMVSSLFSMLPNSGWRANESWPSASIRDALLKDGLGLNFCRYIGQMGGVGSICDVHFCQSCS